MTAGTDIVTYVVRSYPRLSQTFVVDEILALERLGARVEIFSVTNPREPVIQAEVRDVRACVRYLDRVPGGRLPRLHAHLIAALRSPGRYLRALREALAARTARLGYHTASPWSCLDHAVVLATTLRRDDRGAGRPQRHLHAHFAHDPALIALLTHHLTGIPFTFTAHARDIVQVPASALAPRIRQADAVVTCCRANVEYLRSIDGIGRTPIEVVHNGLDLRAFPAIDRRPGLTGGRPMILSVGRLVEKKGFDDLIDACAELARRGRWFRVRIVGDGPLREQLEAAADRLGISNLVEFTGALPRRQIVESYRRAALFALTPYVTDDGDRDGLPTALVEAMAGCLPVVTTAVAGIPELVAHRVNGLLAPARSVPEIAGHLDTVLGDAELAHRLGLAARDTVEHGFDGRASADRLTELFGIVPAPSAMSAGPTPESRCVRI
ncbi:MAG TPA: glycosyltransferase family 4 protein [Actinomycetota bacterium]